MSNKAVKNISIILGCSIVAKILSYIWEATLAAFLGVSDQADAFYMTTSIFGILYPILDLGIWKIFLPIYKSKLVEHDESKAETIANTAITLFLILSMALVLLLVVCAKPLVTIMAPGFASEKQVITVKYLRMSVPSFLLMTTASVVGAMLQSKEKFLGSQIREIGTHISKIVFVFIFYRFWGIYAAVIAMIVGSVFRLLVQLPFINWKWRFRVQFDFRDPDIVPMVKGLPSVAVTAAITHINGLIDKVIASSATSGSVASLNYGYKLMNVFSGMVSSAIATAVYPTMIQHIVEKEDEKLQALIENVICSLMFIIIPISIYCTLFSKNLVVAAFQRGAFDASAASLTAGVFAGYCIGMLFLGVTTVITNVFYGFGDTKISMYISIIEIVLNIALDLLFAKYWGVSALAFATSISAIIGLGIRLIYLKKYIRIEYRNLVIEGTKILFFSIIACTVTYLVISSFIQINVYLSLVISAITTGGLYLILSSLFHVKTLHVVYVILRKKLSHGTVK